MKRIIAVTLVLSLCFSFMTGCNSSKEEETDNTAAVQTAILDEFNKISQIPRESGHEKEISNYLRSWAKGNGFDVIRDSSNNIIINLPATEGYEKAPVTILQCNMDSSIAVQDETVFDPLTTPVKLVTDKAILTASGTSIGADSGIGMASILYVLKNSQKHGPLRAIFTVNGESSLSGAEKLKDKHLEGNYLINFSWPSDKEIGIGSSGTASYDMEHDIEWTPPKNTLPYLISISGLVGGDAEKNINLGGANAIKVIGDILANAQGQGILFELASFNGGTSRDTIPAAASAMIIINESDQKKMQKIIDDAMNAFKDSYGEVEKDYSFTYQEALMPDKVVSFDNNGSIISFIYGIINGIQSTSQTYNNIVESWTNLGLVSTSSGNFVCQVSASSTTEIGLYEITNAHEAISSMSNLKYTYSDGVPRWPDHPDSVLVHSITQLYSSMYDDELSPVITDRKSECGWFVKKNPRLQIVSIGPKIKNVNEPNEELVLKSITKPAEAAIKFLEQTNIM